VICLLFYKGLVYSHGVTETRIIDASDPAKQNKIVKEVADLLESGEVVALPTETVYGLAADVFNAEAVAKIFEVKERPSFDPLIVHVGSYEQVDEVAEVLNLAVSGCSQFSSPKVELYVMSTIPWLGRVASHYNFESGDVNHVTEPPTRTGR